MSLAEFAARVDATLVVVLAVVPLALGAALAWWLRRKPPQAP